MRTVLSAHKPQPPRPVSLMKDKMELAKDYQRFANSIFRLDQLLRTRIYRKQPNQDPIAGQSVVEEEDEGVGGREDALLDPLFAKRKEPDSVRLMWRKTETLSMALRRGCFLPLTVVTEIEEEVRQRLEARRAAEEPTTSVPEEAIAKVKKPSYKRNKAQAASEFLLAQVVKAGAQEEATLSTESPVSEQIPVVAVEDPITEQTLSARTMAMPEMAEGETSPNPIERSPARAYLDAKSPVSRLLLVDRKSLALLPPSDTHYIQSGRETRMEDMRVRNLLKAYMQRQVRVLELLGPEEDLESFFDLRFTGPLARSDLRGLLHPDRPPTAAKQRFLPADTPWTREADDALLAFLQGLLRRQSRLVECMRAWAREEAHDPVPEPKYPMGTKKDPVWSNVAREMWAAGHMRHQLACKQRWLNLVRTGVR